MKVIAVANQKGGTGKTTTANNLAACLVRHSRKVLAIDLDSQADLTSSLGLSPDDLDNTIYGVLKDEQSIKEVVVEIQPGLDLVPANLEMASLDMEMVGAINRDQRLRRALRGLPRPYDYILLDTPPSLGVSSINAFAASDIVLVCVQTHVLPFRAVKKLLLTVNNVAKHYELSIATYALPTMFEKTANAHKAVLEQLRERFDPYCFSPIHKNVRLIEAQAAQSSIIDYDISSSGAVDYLRLASEVINEFEERQDQQNAGRLSN